MTTTWKIATSVGDLLVDPARNLLTLGSSQSQLEPRIMDVLCVLADANGAVVSRDDLIDKIWDVSYGADESLTRAISMIRKSIRSLGVDDEFIRTIPKRGYSLTVDVEPAEGESSVARGTEAGSDNGEKTKLALEATTKQFNWRTVLAGSFFALALAIAAILAWIWSDQAPGPVATETTEKTSIAVLPFTPFTSDQRDAYFADGLSEQLLNALSPISSLDVAARTSSFKFRKSETDIRTIATELGVEYVVEGSMQREDDRIRVTAQLIRAEDGFHVWSATLDEQVGDTFKMQDALVRDISQALQIRLGVGTGEEIAPDRGVDPDAAELYYQAMYHFGNQFRSDGNAQKSYDLLRTAVEIDPEFREAWSALAIIGVGWASGPLAKNKEAFIAQLKEDIATALKLNPNDHNVHVALVFWYSDLEIDIDRALEHLARAKEIAPNAAQTHVAEAVLHWVAGKPKESVESFRRAQRLDPLNVGLQVSLSTRLASIGEYKDAFFFFDECQANSCAQEGFIPYAALAAIFSNDPEIIARWEPVYEDFEQFVETIPSQAVPHVVKVNPASYSIGFSQSDAQQEANEVRELFSQEIITDHIGMWAPTLAGVLPEDTFFESLELAYERRDLFSSLYGFSPLYSENTYPDWVLEHPRYHALWAKPELARLAEIRRANGQLNGLPK